MVVGRTNGRTAARSPSQARLVSVVWRRRGVTPVFRPDFSMAGKIKNQALRRRLGGAFASSIWQQNVRRLALSVVNVSGRSLYRGRRWADAFSGSILEFLYPVRYRDAARHKRQASRLTCFSNFVAAARYRVLLSDPSLSYLKTFCGASSPKVTLVLKRPSVFVCKIRILRSSNTANSGCT